jgi:hypothetical protein
VRDPRLDALRGACLVAMTAAHLTCCVGPLWVLTHPLLVVDAALGFVAVSGAVLGVTARRARQTAAARTARLWRRAARLWAAHLVLLTVGYLLRDATGEPSFLRDPDELGGWWVLLRDSALLLHVDVHLDVLPLYVLLLLLTPLALWGLQSEQTPALLLAAAAVWALTLVHGPPPLPGATGTFGWTGWQLPFVLGLAAGWHADRLRALPHRPRWTGGAALAVALIAALAHLDDRTALLPAWTVEGLDTLFAKAPPGPGAVLLLPACAVVGYATVTALRASRLVAGLALLGRHSLRGYLLLTAVAVWLPPLWNAQGQLERSALAVATTAGLVASARRQERTRARVRARTTTSHSAAEEPPALPGRRGPRGPSPDGADR